MGELVKGEGIGGCYGGMEHENGGGKVAWAAVGGVTAACSCCWGQNAATAAARREGKAG